jgi:hypothetical protein
MVGDALIAVGFAISIWIFLRQRADSRRRDKAEALAMLQAVRDGLAAWAGPYFDKSYDEATARARAQLDFDAVMRGEAWSVFVVPTEPLVALTRRPGTGAHVAKPTIEAVNFALWQIGKFNQFVRQQTDFNSRYLPEVSDAGLPADRRLALAQAALQISFCIEWFGVGDGAWYQRLKGALDENIRALI